MGTALKNSLVRFLVQMGKQIARGFKWWIEMMGKNPALSRDYAVFTWRELHKEKPARRSRRVPTKEPAQVQVSCTKAAACGSA